MSGAATASFVYDGDGNRVKATLGGATTAYIGNYFEWTGSTSTMIKYYYAGTVRVAMRTGSGSGTTGLNWLLSDHLGSTTITANSSGAKIAELRYKAWGESRYSWGTTPTKRQYTGQVSEMATIGLYYYGARFFDPALSRFTSADTIIPGVGDVQAWDRYAAMLNNPIRWVDPTGHTPGPVMHDSDGDAQCNDPEHCMSTEQMNALYNNTNEAVDDQTSSMAILLPPYKPTPTSGPPTPDLVHMLRTPTPPFHPYCSNVTPLSLYFEPMDTPTPTLSPLTWEEVEQVFDDIAAPQLDDFDWTQAFQGPVVIQYPPYVGPTVVDTHKVATIIHDSLTILWSAKEAIKRLIP